MRVGGGPSQKWLLEVAIPYKGAQCLDWPFALAKNGYPQTWEVGSGGAGGQRGAHAVVCEAIHGPRPSKLHDACHGCGRKICVAPAHLRWATKKENQADRRLHGTMSVNRGAAHGMAKLTEDQVREIRASTEPGEILAARYAVSEANVYLVRARRTWVHLK